MATTIKTNLAVSGTAALPIIIDPDAYGDTRRAVQELADMLKRITGATFTVTVGDGLTGIAVGTASDFPALGLNLGGDTPDTVDRYHVQSTGDGLRIIGATPQAVRLAVWYVHRRLGYRQYFPSGHWEIVPKKADLSLYVNTTRSPSFARRGMILDCSTWQEDRQRVENWCIRNGVHGQTVSTKADYGHGNSYLSIINRNPAKFSAFPEWRSLVNGRRTGRQLCLSNTECRTWVVQEVIQRHIAAGLPTFGISLNPSDCDDRCECDACQAMGSYTDQALLLVNELQAAIDQQLGKPYHASFMAYNFTAAPPTIQVRDGVVVIVTSGYTIPDGYNTYSLMDAWKAKGAKRFGYYDYLTVYAWSLDKLGVSRGANPSDAVLDVSCAHAHGASYYNCVISNNWGAYGLGNYLVARALFDVQDIAVNTQIEEFLRLCFGNAKEIMRQFYQILNPVYGESLRYPTLGKLYRLLRDALACRITPEQRQRVLDLGLFLKYQETLLDYLTAPADQRQFRYELLLTMVSTLRNTSMAHGWAVWRMLDTLDKAVTMPDECDPLKYTLTSTPPNTLMFPPTEFGSLECERYIELGSWITPNRPPIAIDSAVQTRNGNAMTITLQATDADLDELTYQVVSGTTHGTLYDMRDKRVNYKPAAGFKGTDSFTFYASDGEDVSNNATVTITCL